LLWCLQTCFVVVDKYSACDVEKVETEPEEVEDKEFKEDNWLHWCVCKCTKSGSFEWRFFFFSRAFDFDFFLS
jgi:hypothetical protein